jgi:hypothetical protein
VEVDGQVAAPERPAVGGVGSEEDDAGDEVEPVAEGGAAGEGDVGGADLEGTR